MTMANAPRVGQDDADIKVIWAAQKQEYFCERDWTAQNRQTEVICPSGYALLNERWSICRSNLNRLIFVQPTPD